MNETQGLAKFPYLEKNEQVKESLHPGQVDLEKVFYRMMNQNGLEFRVCYNELNSTGETK